MPVVSLGDQGFFDSSSVIQHAVAQFLAQKAAEERLQREAQAFVPEQAHRVASASTATAQAANVPQQISDENTLRALTMGDRASALKFDQQANPLRLDLLASNAGAAAAQNRRFDALSPLVLRSAENDATRGEKLLPLDVRKSETEAKLGEDTLQANTQHAKANALLAEQHTQPTDSSTTSTVDPLGNITENITHTRNGQPAGSESKIMRGNRPGTSKIAYMSDLDPTTGQIIRKPIVINTGANGEAEVTAVGGGAPAAPAVDKTTASLVDKYFEEGANGAVPKTTFFLGKPKLPPTSQERMQLKTLISDPQTAQRYGINLDALAPLQQALGTGGAAKPAAAPASAAPAPGGAPAKVAPTPVTKVVTPTVATPAAVAPAAVKKARDYAPGEVFKQNGALYKKTAPVGQPGAEPYKAP